MSKHPDQERAARGEIFRNGKLVHAEPGEKVDAKKYGTLILTCGKCRQTFTETMASEHLKKCQPTGARCGKCGKLFMPHEFLPHFKECRGLLQELHHAD